METAQLPPAVHARFDDSVADLWRARVEQHTQDSYAGVRISKFPEDLRVYEQLLWLDAPRIVIELGSQFGGSALWFRDRLRTLAGYGRVHDPYVIAVDIDIEPIHDTLRRQHPRALNDIIPVAGDVCDPELPKQIGRMLEPNDQCMIIEDSAHVYETTYAALAGFSQFVSPGGFYVVEDGCVDIEEMRVREDWPHGVLPAIADWLETATGKEFKVQPDMELYGITCHPGGFLRRIEA